MFAAVSSALPKFITKVGGFKNKSGSSSIPYIEIFGFIRIVVSKLPVSNPTDKLVIKGYEILEPAFKVFVISQLYKSSI